MRKAWDGAAVFYMPKMPKIFRAGLEFSLDSLEKGARPRVLVLKRKPLGTKGIKDARISFLQYFFDHGAW